MRACLILAALPALAFAHDIVRTESKIEVRGSTARAALLVNLPELKGPSIPFDATGRITADELDRVIPEIFAVVRGHYKLTADGAPSNPTLDRYVLVDGHAVHLELSFPFSQPPSSVTVTSTMHEVMAPGHQHIMTLTMNGVSHEAVLNAQSPSATFTGQSPTRLQTLWKFGLLGIRHIFTGYDHLAFLLGLLVVTTSLGSLVAVVTSFTIAHSITLALATFGLVALPTRLTESVIALSILYVGIENLAGFRVMKRHYVTFLFGLVHGFGFSSILREMDLPRPDLALSLFSFNLGVELGQVAFVLLVYPAVRDLVRSGWTKLQPVISAAIAALAAWWFIERAFLG